MRSAEEIASDVYAHLALLSTKQLLAAVARIAQLEALGAAAAIAHEQKVRLVDSGDLSNCCYASYITEDINRLAVACG